MDANFANLPLWFVPACTAGAGVLIAAIRMRPANRTADEKIADGQYNRLLQWAEKMEERVKALEQEVEECHRERDEALARALKAEAIQLGMGIGRQRAADVVAGDRAEQREQRKREEGK